MELSSLKLLMSAKDKRSHGNGKSKPVNVSPEREKHTVTGALVVLAPVIFLYDHFHHALTA